MRKGKENHVEHVCAFIYEHPVGEAKLRDSPLLYPSSWENLDPEEKKGSRGRGMKPHGPAVTEEVRDVTLKGQFIKIKKVIIYSIHYD